MRTIFISILLLAACFSATSQTKFGFNAGYIYSHLMDGDGKTFDSHELTAKLHGQSGYFVGIYADNQLNDKLFIQYGMQFVNGGGLMEAHLKEERLGFMSRVNLNHLQFPVLLKYSLLNRLLLTGGPYAGFKFSTRYDITEYYGFPAFDLNAPKKLEKELEKQTNPNLSLMNLGLSGGLEFILSHRLTLTGNYNYTFTNLSSKKEESLKMHFARAGISFNLAKKRS